MARKSRKAAGNHEIEPQQEPVDEGRICVPMKTAAYVRESNEDGGHPASDTIDTQIALLYQFIDGRSDLKLADTYIDNGYSGTNFRRPEFKRLMEDVRTGRIQCIVVKDLSRFGRNYLETGYYIESVFPGMQVRFIAVTDQFDSFHAGKSDSLSVPIRNMVNAMYAKDISKKICVSAEQRRKRSDSMPQGTAPYGYRFSEHKDCFLADPDAAPYVRMIFQWAAAGLPVREIVCRLTFLGAKTPAAYSPWKGHVKDLQKVWTNTIVGKILTNPNYTGDVVMGRRQQALCKGLDRHSTDREEWTVRENVHEPLVTKEDYELVQTNRHKSSSTTEETESSEAHSREPDHFKGLIYCAECGRRMRFRRYPSRGNCAVYSCEKRKGAAPCNGYTIYEGFLKIFIMDQIRFLVQVMSEQKVILQSIRVPDSGKRPLLSLEKKIAAQQSKTEAAERKIEKLYEDHLTEIVAEEDYKNLKKKYLSDLQDQRALLKAFTSRQKQIDELLAQFSETERKWSAYKGAYVFDENLVHQLVDRISVSSRGTIEVRFRCQDMVDQVMELTGGVSENENGIVSQAF